MADSNHITSNPPAQTANHQRVLLDGAGQSVPFGDREFDLLHTMTARAGEIGGGKRNNPLWNGHIIPATFPPGVHVPEEPPPASTP